MCCCTGNRPATEKVNWINAALKSSHAEMLLKIEYIICFKYFSRQKKQSMVKYRYQTKWTERNFYVTGSKTKGNLVWISGGISKVRIWETIRIKKIPWIRILQSRRYSFASPQLQITWEARPGSCTCPCCPPAFPDTLCLWGYQCTSWSHSPSAWIWKRYLIKYCRWFVKFDRAKINKVSRGEVRKVLISQCFGLPTA